MKLVRFGPAGNEKPGILDKDGKHPRPVEGRAGHRRRRALARRASPRSGRPSIDKLPLVTGKPAPRRLRRRGRQLHRHRAELRRPRRRGRHADPEGADHLQQGADLHLRAERRHHHPEGLDQARLGGRARHRHRPARALSRRRTRRWTRSPAIASANDVSEREFQIERAGQWTKGKGCETFGPLGPWLVTKDEIKDPQNLDMWLDVNGETRQSGNTKTMIFGVAAPRLVLLAVLRLEPGDVIITGTPPGVGARHEAGAEVPQGRRRGHARHRRPRRADAEGRDPQDSGCRRSRLDAMAGHRRAKRRRSSNGHRRAKRRRSSNGHRRAKRHRSSNGYRRAKRRRSSNGYGPAIDVLAPFSTAAGRRGEERPTRMKLLASLVTCCGLGFVAVAIQPAAAKDAPRAVERNLPAVKFDGKHAATLRYGELQRDARQRAGVRREFARAGVHRPLARSGGFFRSHRGGGGRRAADRGARAAPRPRDAGAPGRDDRLHGRRALLHGDQDRHRAGAGPMARARRRPARRRRLPVRRRRQRRRQGADQLRQRVPLRLRLLRRLVRADADRQARWQRHQ